MRYSIEAEVLSCSDPYIDGSFSLFGSQSGSNIEKAETTPDHSTLDV